MSTGAVPTGIVLSVEDGRADVSTSRSGACAGCSDVAACGLSDAVSCTQVVTVRNPVGARPGDSVELALPESAALRLSLLVWVVPFAGMVVGAVAGSAAGDGGTLLGALAGAGGAFAGLHRVDRRLAASRRLTPFIARVMTEDVR
ncbi:MAG TPA: SoxR reducing system RseC family protein [bacterium]|nr:SoxR reducing system RseC family protein [bacterium]